MAKGAGDVGSSLRPLPVFDFALPMVKYNLATLALKGFSSCGTGPQSLSRSWQLAGRQETGHWQDAIPLLRVLRAECGHVP